MDAEVSEMFAKFKEQDPENEKCFDCGVPNPQWASVSHGTFICLLCSANHRRFGTNISVVRSITLNSWTSDYLAMMSVGGNAKCRAYFEEQNIARLSMDAKYKSKAAAHYREIIKALASNCPPPAPLPEGTGASPMEQDLQHAATLDPAKAPKSESELSGKSASFVEKAKSAQFPNKWDSVTGTFTDIWGKATAAAQMAATTVKDPQLVTHLKSWVDDRKKNVSSAVQTVQDDQFWAQAQGKASEKLHAVVDIMHTAKAQAGNWIGQVMGENELSETGPNPVSSRHLSEAASSSSTAPS